MLTVHKETKPKERKDFLQQELDCQVEDFLSNGGVVQKIQSGISSIDMAKKRTAKEQRMLLRGEKLKVESGND